MKNDENIELGLNEISRISNINKSTVYKILNTLTKRNIISQNSFTSKYRLSFGVLELASKVLKDTNLFEVSRPIITELSRDTESTVTLGFRYNYKLVFLDRIDGNESVNFYCEIGKQMPFYKGAAAKALFSHIDKLELEDLKKNPKKNPHINEQTHINNFFKQNVEIKKNGYALSDEEIDVGVLALGAPVFRYDGVVIASIAIATIKETITYEKKMKLIEKLLTSSKKISELLGYTKD